MGRKKKSRKQNKEQRQKKQKDKKKPNWARRKPGRPKKKKSMPPRIGRAKYDKFRGDEIVVVAREIRELVDKERIHEKRPGGRGRPPADKRDIIKCLLFLELLKCVIQKSPSILKLHAGLLGLTSVPAPRTLYNYRAKPGMTSTLQRLQFASAYACWLKETMAATDGTGNPHTGGKAWSNDRLDAREYRGYDKSHYIIGVKSLVIPVTKVTRGTWSEIPEFEYLVRGAVPGSGIKTVAADSGLVAVENYEVARELGVTPYIKPKDNAVFRPHPANAYERAVCFATRFPERFKETYRWRVKAESAIHAKKTACGDVLRGQFPSSRRNQEICRIIIHNLRMSVMASYGE